MAEPISVLLAVLALLFFIYLVVRFSRVYQPARARCPVDEKRYNVTLLRRLNASWKLGPPLDIISCDAFSDPNHVTCRKPCLRQGLDGLQT